MGRDHLIDPKSHSASIPDVQNLLSGAGDIQIECQKQKNNLLHDVNSLEGGACCGRGAFIMGYKST